MCGIVYSASFTGLPVNQKIIDRYEKQKDRGMNGFGFYIPPTNQLTHNTRESRIKNLLKRTDATEVLFHHRFPTSTLNVRNGCHPFSTKDTFKNQYIMVHNGVLWNEDELQEEHEKLGIKYVSEMKDGSFNDSEALLYDIALTLEGKQEALQAYGSIAFVVIERNKKGKPVNVHFGRNLGNPLKMTFNKKELTLASEGAGDDIKPHFLYTFNYKSKKITQKPLSIPTASMVQYTSNQYEDYDDDWYSNSRYVSQTYSDAGSLAPYLSPQAQHYSDSDNVCSDYQDDYYNENDSKMLADGYKRSKTGVWIPEGVNEGALFDRFYSPLPLYHESEADVNRCAKDYLDDALGDYDDALDYIAYDIDKFKDEVDRIEQLENVADLDDQDTNKLLQLYEVLPVFERALSLLDTTQVTMQRKQVTNVISSVRSKRTSEASVVGEVIKEMSKKNQENQTVLEGLS